MQLQDNLGDRLSHVMQSLHVEIRNDYDFHEIAEHNSHGHLFPLLLFQRQQVVQSKSRGIIKMPGSSSCPAHCVRAAEVQECSWIYSRSRECLSPQHSVTIPSGNGRNISLPSTAKGRRIGHRGQPTQTPNPLLGQKDTLEGGDRVPL